MKTSGLQGIGRQHSGVRGHANFEVRRLTTNSLFHTIMPTENNANPHFLINVVRSNVGVVSPGQPPGARGLDAQKRSPVPGTHSRCGSPFIFSARSRMAQRGTAAKRQHCHALRSLMRQSAARISCRPEWLKRTPTDRQTHLWVFTRSVFPALSGSDGAAPPCGPARCARASLCADPHREHETQTRARLAPLLRGREHGPVC